MTLRTRPSSLKSPSTITKLVKDHTKIVQRPLRLAPKNQHPLKGAPEKSRLTTTSNR